MTTSRVTFCRICEASCGLVAELQGDRIMSIQPDAEHVVSRGFACVKGVRYAELHDSPQRVLTPLKRVGASYEPISWPVALAEIGEKVRALRAQHGTDSVGLYLGNPAAFSPLHIVSARQFAVGLGSRHFYTAGSQDCNNKFVVSEEVFGSPMLQPIPDFDHARLIVIIGSNPVISQLSFANFPRALERLKAVERAGGRVLFVNPRRIESAQQVGELLFIKPGADVYFILALAHLVLAARPIDPQLAARVDGYAELCACVREWSPERVETVTGIAAQTIRELASAYCSTDRAVIYAGTGVNQGPHGTLCVWLLHAMALVSGHFDQPGNMIVTRAMLRTARAHEHGERIRHKTPRMSEHRSVMATLPAGVLPDEVFTPGPGQLHGLFVSAGNPVLSCPNSERMREALAKLDLLVSIDLFRNETGQLAHYILPATSFLERADMPLGMGGYQPIPYAQYAEPIVPPRGEARDEWWIFTRLARACGVAISDSRLAQRWLNASTGETSWLPSSLRFTPQLFYRLVALADGVALGSLRKQPHGRLLSPYRPGAFMRAGPLTKNGKFQLAPLRFLSAVAQLDRSALAADGGGLMLICKRERRTHNSWMHHAPGLSGGARATNYLYMHPQDASQRGLVDHSLVEVRSNTGSVRVPVRFTKDIMPGTVALPHGWGHQPADAPSSSIKGVNTNLLFPDGPASLEALSGMALLTAIQVQVSAVEVGSKHSV